MTRIIAHMIIGSEEEPFLLHALNNISEHVELIIINDNGSHWLNQDRISQSRFAQERRLIYIRSNFTDFASARNLCFYHTPAESWDYLLRLDADEVHYPEKFAQIIQEIESKKEHNLDSFRVPFYHLLSFKIYQSYETVAQIFRWEFANHYRWSGSVHEIMPAGRQITLQPFFVHYSYTIAQRKVFRKWQRYAELEGRPDFYDGRDQNNIITDRYATAGALFLHPHPQGIEKIIEEKQVIYDYHHVKETVLICVRNHDETETQKTINHLWETANQDFPKEIVVFDAQKKFSDFRDWVTKILETEGFEKYGSVLWIESGTVFTSEHWLKALVSLMYCEYGYDAYQPEGAQNTALIPRDAWLKNKHWYWDTLKSYRTSYVTVEERKV